MKREEKIFTLVAHAYKDEEVEEDISYYFPCGKVEPPGAEWLASKGQSHIGAALMESFLIGATFSDQTGSTRAKDRRASVNRGELGPNLFRKSIDQGSGLIQKTKSKSRTASWLNKMNSIIKSVKPKIKT